MKCTIEIDGRSVNIDLSKPLDISMPLTPNAPQANAWWAVPFSAQPVRMGDFVGSVAEGGPVNFNNVQICPHGNGTHTECVGHISKEPYSVNTCLQTYWFPAELVSIYPERQDNDDRVITLEQIQDALEGVDIPKAVIIRTQPNDELKLTRQYSGTNPAYIHHSAVAWLVEQGVDHLLLDLPSVDREEDAGELAAHKAFWRYPGSEVRTHATITELIYVPDHIKDDSYMLNIQIAPFDMDAAPSKPVLYALVAS